jgi:hypothetical protein
MYLYTKHLNLYIMIYHSTLLRCALYDLLYHHKEKLHVNLPIPVRRRDDLTSHVSHMLATRRNRAKRTRMPNPGTPEAQKAPHLNIQTPRKPAGHTSLPPPSTTRNHAAQIHTPGSQTRAPLLPRQKRIPPRLQRALRRALGRRPVQNRPCCNPRSQCRESKWVDQEWRGTAWCAAERAEQWRRVR